ncbi:MAG TPA: methyltransferase regulatory domain-containing protein [Roseiarcus sp.]|jgi:SAM-dependent methyltransferase
MVAGTNARDEAEALREAIARTRQSYDETPYVSAPLIRQHPGRMAAIARWFGLDPPPARTARVLEIGCASGGHVIPLAAALPDARFLGVDLSGAQIAAGQARVDRLGLGNITLSARSFADVGEADGAFDYIVCHGVYSWIPEALREDLLRVCRERLAPNGVAMISFNVLPGWRLFQIARDTMLLHARIRNDPETRAAETRALFELLAEQSLDKYTYGRFWREEARRMAAGGDAYLAHEIFEDANLPVTFSDFHAALDRHRLAYLSESLIAAGNEENLAPAAAASVRALARGEDRAREQYLDIFSGRSFREALIIHAARAGAIDRTPPRERIDDFHFIAPLDLVVKPVEGRNEQFFVADGDEGVHVAGAEVAVALGRLIARLPRSSQLEDIAPVDSCAPEVRAAVADALLRMVQSSQCAVSLTAVDCAAGLSERPVAWSLAASDARVGDATATLRHAPVQLEPMQRLLLPLLDGTRTRDELVEFAVGLAEQSVLQFTGPQGKVEGREKFVERLGPATDRCLASLLRIGLLIA